MTANTTESTDAYGRAMRRLRRTGEAELHANERDALREACDALIFGDDDAQSRLTAAREVCESLVGSGRWTEDRAGSLLEEIEACGGRTVLAAC